LLHDRLELMNHAGLIYKKKDNYSPVFRVSQSKLKKVSALVSYQL
jgi:hypothetical protein